ncbi:aminotransferase class V-fold PLP-dependent enzyme [soil metagenome]
MKAAFSRFLGADPNRLHAAAHSHHPWPDVTYAAHMRAWEDAARLMDDKWDHVFGTVVPSARRRVAAVLGLDDPDTLVFAPNTHEFVVRIASTLPQPFRVLTSDSEFHSFSRQAARWEEDGVVVDRVPAEPFGTFPERFMAAHDGHDLVFMSHVHFNSGYVLADLEGVVKTLEGSQVVIDGYHGFMAVPSDLSAVADRAYYLAGGYKYAMAGEGACFLHVPPSAPQRPANTGWWAGFGALTEKREDVPYGPGGQRFAGATADPSGIYRLDSVLGWLEEEGPGVAERHRTVTELQDQLLGALPEELTEQLVVDAASRPRGPILAFERPDAEAIYSRLHRRGVVTDYRGDRWRVGLGIYHDEADVELLADAVVEATEEHT